jgi:TolB-like protein
MPSILRFDSFEVDLAAHQLFRNGTRIRLRDQSFQVLVALLDRAGEVVSRQELRDRLWTDETFVDFENSLNTAVARLREALCDSADRPHYIETLPRLGYRFIAAISRSVAPGEPAVPGATRLIVLPFVNSSGDPSQAFFGDAMTGEIITELSTLAPAALGVIARTTAMHYKNTHKDVAAIGRELSVQWVVEGSAGCADDRVSLTVQLVRVRDQTHVFAKRYEADLGELAALKQSIAQAIGAQVGIASQPERMGTGAAAGSQARKRRTPDRAAYSNYLQGRYYLDRGLSPEGWAHARRHLEAAIARDPHFAMAHDALAELWWEIGFFAVAPPRQALALGMPHAIQAVDIDSGLAEAHAMLAQYRKQVDFGWAEVQREMALAFELNPMSATVRRRHLPKETYVPPTSYAWLHIGLGEIDQFFEWMDRAIDARDHMIMPIKSYAFFDPIRGDSRYGALLRKMNLE